VTIWPFKTYPPLIVDLWITLFKMNGMCYDFQTDFYRGGNGKVVPEVAELIWAEKAAASLMVADY
jgi:hypothetical protein